MQLSDFQHQARQVINSDSLTYRQRVHALAAVAENSLDAPKVSAAAESAIESGLIDTLGEGNAPYRPRYLLPDYAKAVAQGSRYLQLDAPTNLTDAIAFLLSMYSQVPSITGYPVYIGDVDRILEPFAAGHDDERLRSLMQLMWITIDRTLPDAFTHGNLGPADSRVGRTILALERELLQTVPNLTLRVSDETPDSLLLDAVQTVFACGKPHFVNDGMMRRDLGDSYGVVSCYNSLKVAGGSHTLVRLNLAEAAARHLAVGGAGIDTFIDDALPRHVELMNEVLAARIRSVVEEARFFDHSWLVDEGVVSLDRMSAMFGIYGLAESVNTLVSRDGGDGKYGLDTEATAVGWRVLERLHSLVGESELPYCDGNGGRAFFHSQAGMDYDKDVTAGIRIPIGTEPPLHEHLLTVAPMHTLFPSGVSDIFRFDETAVRNPAAVVQVIRGAMAQGMRDFTFNLNSNDFIRITGYLVRKSDIAALADSIVARRGSDRTAATTVDNSHVTDRKPKRVISMESVGRLTGK